MVLLVIEGHDLAGKSSVIQEFKKSNKEILRMEVKSFENIEQQSKAYNESLIKYIQDDKIHIADRALLSSIIYAGHYNRKEDLKYVWDILEKNSDKLYFVILACTDDVILKRSELREEKLVKLKDIIEIRDDYLIFYDTYLDEFNLKVICTDNITPEAIYEKICTWMRYFGFDLCVL